MSAKTLTDELKKSAFIRMKVPADQVEAFIERIVSLPDYEREKALEVVHKAEKTFAEFAETEAEKANDFVGKIETFRTKTSEKYQKTGETIRKSSKKIINLRKKIKKQ